MQTKYSSSHNTHPSNTTDEEEGDNGGRMDDARASEVRMANTNASKSHSWRGDHPMKDQQNGYVSSIH